ncbi:MAG: TlpA family protein disulfide reductase [Thermodesulfovibrio sp.]|nr:TlpA family protein disulfide reductase [Thermodesulfovibrio sp.]
MKKFIFSFFLFFLIFLDEGQGALKKGDLAPDFNIIGIDGYSSNIYQFKSKVILVEFLSKKCFACDMVIPDINRLREKFSNEQLVIIGVLFSDEISNLAELYDFSKDRGIKYPVYFTDIKYKKLYNVFGFPNFFILNEKKQIIQIYRGITSDTFGLLNSEIEKVLKKGGK